MISRAMLAALLGGAIVSACAQTPPTRVIRSTCTTPTCIVKVAVNNGRVSVDIDELEIKGNRDVRIVWHLPANYSFNTALGDGVFLKRDDDGQFDDQYATDSDSGEATGDRRKGKNFHWRNKNTVKKIYQYKILFHDRSGDAFFLDPTIMNDG